MTETGIVMSTGMENERRVAVSGSELMRLEDGDLIGLGARFLGLTPVDVDDDR